MILNILASDGRVLYRVSGYPVAHFNGDYQDRLEDCIRDEFGDEFEISVTNADPRLQ